MYKLIKSKAFWLGLIVIVGSILLINLTATNRQDISVVERAIRNFYTPLQSGVNSVSDIFNSWGNTLASKKSLNRRISSLTRENEQLKLRVQVLSEDRAELQRLRRMVNFTEQNKLTYNLAAARVIARNHNNWYNSLMIDKGFQDGIKKDMAVINPDGLIGRVVSVSNHSAQVFLITDREVAVGAILQRTRETNGIVEGTDDNNALKMDNIPYYSKIIKGDKVITSGLSEYYPKGILIGSIKKVTRDPNGLLLSAAVTPAVNFDKLEEVLVVTGYHAPIDNTVGAKE